MDITEPTQPSPGAEAGTAAPATAAPLHGEPLPVELMNTVWADRQGVHDALRDPEDLAAWLRGIGARLPEGITDGAGPYPGNGNGRGNGFGAGNGDGPVRNKGGSSGLGSGSGTGARTADDPYGFGTSAGLPGLVGEFRQLRDALRRLAAETTGDDRSAARAAGSPPDVATAVDHLNAAARYAPASSYLTWPGLPGGGATRTLRSPYPPAAAALSVIAEQAAELFAGGTAAQLRACHAPGCVLYFVKTHPRREWCSAGCGNRARVARHYQRHHGPRPHGH